jgi:hypothetical protein
MRRIDQTVKRVDVPLFHTNVYVSDETTMQFLREPEARIRRGNFRWVLYSAFLLAFWSKDCVEILRLYLSLI